MRIRRKGSDGGQNGLKSIIYQLNSDNFPRVRVGVGAKPHPYYDLADWVLSKFQDDEIEKIDSASERAMLAAEEIIKNGAQAAAQLYNGKS